LATVTGLTADRMLAIEGASVVDGDVVGDNLILTQHNGTQINAGNVRGPAGPQGPVGSDLSVLSAIPVLDVGLANQIRAGRQLSPADFNAVGLSAPLALWNLSDLSDSSGNGRALLNKGAITFASGINGLATTAAQFTGSTGQTLYIADIGTAADPFRIKIGSWGCWFRTAKRGVGQYLLSKIGAAGTNALACYSLYVSTVNAVNASACDGAQALLAPGVQDVADDRWHFAVVVFDGTLLRTYVDGMLEGQVNGTLIMNQAVGSPLNLGSFGADAATAGTLPFYGRIDEMFITNDILSEDQIRNLYCAKLTHTLGSVPSRLTLNVRRRRRAPAFVVGDFTAQPLRLHNFSAGSLTDEGSNAVNLQNNGVIVVAGVDGTKDNAYHCQGQNLSSTDAGLPGGLSPRSFGCWYRHSMTGSAGIIAWGGTINNADTRLGLANGAVASNNGTDSMSGPVTQDGLWHFVVIVEDNAALDGLKRKMYLDGRLVGSSTVMNAVTLTGANRFRIGATQDALNPYYGAVDNVFVCGYAMTQEEILRLYAKATQTLMPSPKVVGDHVEAMSSGNLLATFDTLDSIAQVDLRVAA
jgi:Concanavalin A-like lectin/glucanases superfamily